MIASKGAPAVAAGETPPNGEPLNGVPPDPSDPSDPAAGDPPADDGEPPNGKPAKASESARLRREQRSLYRHRLEEMLRTSAELTESKGDDPGGEVFDELSKRFPADSIAWVKDADWSGPVNVGADQIDTSHADTWAASTDGTAEKYRGKLRAKLAEGKHAKPVILVRTPGAEKDIVIDGHHRALAAIAESRPIRAYVGRAADATGPWLETHSSQKDGNK